jgi:hypothetical protein
VGGVVGVGDCGFAGAVDGWGGTVGVGTVGVTTVGVGTLVVAVTVCVARGVVCRRAVVA